VACSPSMQGSDSLSVSTLGGGDEERLLKYRIVLTTYCCAKDCVRPFAEGQELAWQRQVGVIASSFPLAVGGRSRVC
jgi:hypothetical protein